MHVYRYIPFERFKEVVEEKTLYFVNPFVYWSDKKEGFLYRIAQSSKQIARIEEMLKNNRYKDKIIMQLKQGGLCYSNCIKKNEISDWYGMRCQSWCKEENSKEMWQAYSFNNQSICIEVWLHKLACLHYGKNKIEWLPVEYNNDLSTKDIMINDKVLYKELKKVCDKSNFFYTLVLTTKSKEYSFEKECRLYVGLLDYDTGEYIGKDDEKEGIKVTIDEDISSFISKVYCHPESPNDYKNKIEEYCNKHKLRFIRNDI